MNVALFVTCLTDTFAPRVGIAVVRVLRHFGCDVVFPEGQSCCGQPAYNNGFHAEAAAQGRHMIDAFDFDGYDAVVTPSGSCAAMVIHHLPPLLADDPDYAERSRRLADRTFEFGVFLNDVLCVDWSSIRVNPAVPMTYHYSCHMRAIQPLEHAADMVSRLGGIDYRPLDGIEQCCGFGGAFGAIFPEISGEMTRAKVAAIAATGAHIAICNDAGCTFTIEGTARKQGHDIRFKHLAEVVAEALGLMDDMP